VLHIGRLRPYKAGSLPQSGAPEKHFSLVGVGLTCKHLARLGMKLEAPAKDKPSSLLQTFINYGCKKFYNIVSSVQI
jgi:hypothetical protein